MKTAKMIKATVFTEEDGSTHKVVGKTVGDVLESIFKYLIRKVYNPFIQVFVTLSTGESFRWSHSTAYHCFIGRRISEKEALNRMIKRAA